jgi:malonyl-CoA/methylmalonyl-CoA synthetase
MNLSNPYVGDRVPGSVGTPLPEVSARIVDAKGKDVTPGDEGELLVRGSNVFAGYWQAPEKTAESFVHDDLGRRWFRTGDLARQDSTTGVFTLLGRRTELIISGGFNIYPREIEELLSAYPGVKEAAVAGCPHAEWGEVPVAFLVVEGALDNDALITWCKTQLAAFKVPRTIHVVDALPRNALGKVQKHLLPR